MEYFWGHIKIGLPFSQTVDPAISYGSYPPRTLHFPTTTPSVSLFVFESKRVRQVIYFREPILKKKGLELFGWPISSPR